MSKYHALWEYVSQNGGNKIVLSFDEIKTLTGFPIDHSFLSYKKELTEYGYKVGKISMKERTVEFLKE